jgi:hypothetical protein
MDDSLLLGVWRYLMPVPRPIWQKQVAQDSLRTYSGLSFMSPDHHLIRNFVVRELPRQGQPLAPEFIAQNLDMPINRVVAILDDLEKHMTFLYRSGGDAVTWAYPVTVERTPHKVTFISGEKLYAA